jgi:wyosine [tRNA(Phe)-imidazoG37] synthetase (radical SAM superfamily)
MCCPSWLPTSITDGGKMSITEGWFGETSNKIRESVLDGSFSYCNHKLCPDLSSVLGGRTTETNNFKLKENFIEPQVPMVETVLYGQDRSCNLKCPSCRVNVIPNDNVNSPEHINKQALQDEIENTFGSSITRVLLTGSGDPIYSKIYRDFLINFDSKKYPKMDTIVLVTNGILLTEKMWNKFNCHEYIKILDISLDAGTKDTYENVTRLGGVWEILLDNIKFIIGLTDIKREFVFSFVVSEYNFKEMAMAVELIDNITHNMYGTKQINFRQHVYWESGAFSQEKVNKIGVFNPSHSQHAEFLEQLKIVDKHPHVNHNFHHLLDNGSI